MKPLIEKTLILAHRGASAYAPENTLEAFSLAADMGADGVELDVHLTADGQLVVHHDDKINRTSNAQGTVREYTLAELRAFDFGYRFYNGERRGIRIPTLDEVYELLAPRGLIVNVEIKSKDPAVCLACDAAAKRHRMEDRVIYSSFNHFQLRQIREVCPTAFIAPLYDFNMLNPWNYCLDIGAQAVHPEFSQIRAVPDYVESCHARGLRVHAWTANAPEDIRFLLDAGADAIITNNPDIALELRG